MADFVIRLIANIRKAQRAGLQPVFIRGGGVVSRPAIALGRLPPVAPKPPLRALSGGSSMSLVLTTRSTVSSSAMPGG